MILVSFESGRISIKNRAVFHDFGVVGTRGSSRFDRRHSREIRRNLSSDKQFYKAMVGISQLFDRGKNISTTYHFRENPAKFPTSKRYKSISTTYLCGISTTFPQYSRPPAVYIYEVPKTLYTVFVTSRKRF